MIPWSTGARRHGRLGPPLDAGYVIAPLYYSTLFQRVYNGFVHVVSLG